MAAPGGLVICDECEEYELRRDHWRSWLVQRALLAVLPKPKRSPFAGISSMVSAALGGGTWSSAPPSHYDRHREEYARTGSEIELQRMLRQIDA
jgi:hypothetical protein